MRRGGAGVAILMIILLLLFCFSKLCTCISIKLLKTKNCLKTEVAVAEAATKSALRQL